MVFFEKGWQRGHIERAAIGIVRIDDDRDRGAGRNLEIAKVERELLLRAQWRLGVSLRDLGKKAVGGRQQVGLPAEAIEDLPEDQLGACIEMDR